MSCVQVAGLAGIPVREPAAGRVYGLNLDDLEERGTCHAILQRTILNTQTPKFGLLRSCTDSSGLGKLRKLLSLRLSIGAPGFL